MPKKETEAVQSDYERRFLTLIWYLNAPLEQPGPVVRDLTVICSRRAPKLMAEATAHPSIGSRADPRWQFTPELGVHYDFGPKLVGDLSSDKDWLSLPQDTGTIIVESIGEWPKTKPRFGSLAVAYDSSVSLFGPVGAVLSVALDCERVFNDDSEAMWECVQELLSALEAAYPAYYGLVHTAPVAETHAGNLWTMLIRPVPWTREVERHLWSTDPDRKGRVQAVYWGNYLGPDLRKLADPEGSLVSRYLAENGLKEPWRSQTVREFDSGGLFVVVDPDPLSVGEPAVSDGAIENATWLTREFRKRGVM